MWAPCDLAYHVSKLQPSDKGSIQLNEESTTVLTRENKGVLKSYHPKEAFEINLRGYISSITPALKCVTDVQGTDGKGMLLKYASS